MLTLKYSTPPNLNQPKHVSRQGKERETLDEIADHSWAKAGQQSSGSFFSDNLSECPDHAFAVLERLELNTCLHHIHWSQGAVRDACANAACQGPFHIIDGVVCCLRCRGSD
jgi:hypothetical protein